MSESETTTDATFVAYEYTAVPVKREMESLYRDCYRSFGWTMEGYVPSVAPTGTVTLRLKRDRKIRARAVLAELQRTCENALTSIDSLERSKTSTATARAIVVGIIGCAFLAGSIFSFDAGLIPLFVVLGALGLVGWTLPYFVHNAVRAKKTAQVAPMIDREYDIVYETCEQANGLLAG